MGNFTNSKAQFTELLFENRNKNYGAYVIRRDYDRRLLVSTAVTVAFFLLAIILPKLFGGVVQEISLSENPIDTVRVIEMNLDPKTDTPKSDPPPKTATPKGNTGLAINPVDSNAIVKEDTTDYDPFKIGDPKGTDTTGTIAFNSGTGKDTLTQKKDTNVIVTVAEVNPEFPGGMAALYKFLKDNIKYPRQALEDEISGTVYLSFVVNRDGSITDIVPMNKVYGGLDKEAIRVVGLMPKWKPGMMGHETVRVKYSIPVKFAYKK
jgi:periplasmic protein TonB